MVTRPVSRQEFWQACIFGYVEVAERYIAENIGNPAAFNNSDNPFLSAAAKGHARIVAAMLKVPGILVDEKGDSISAPLISAIGNGHEDVVRLLTQDGRVNVNLVGWKGCTPMSVAIEAGNKAIVTLLLEAGASIPKIDKNKINKEIEDLIVNWQKNLNPKRKIGMLLQPYLSEDYQLALRSTCKDFRDAMQDCQLGPWQTKKQFAMAVSGNFCRGTKKELNRSWNYYNQIFFDGDNQPAIIHKIKAHSLGIYSIDLKNSMKQSGRIYDPEHEHTPSFNAIWTIANIHKGRAFLIISDIEEHTLKRKSGYDSVSAFATEIAGAMQAKYTPQLDGNFLRLNPSDQATRSQVKLKDVKLSDNQVMMFARKTKEFKDKAFAGMESANKLRRGPHHIS